MHPSPHTRAGRATARCRRAGRVILSVRALPNSAKGKGMERGLNAKLAMFAVVAAFVFLTACSQPKPSTVETPPDFEGKLLVLTTTGGLCADPAGCGSKFTILDDGRYT